MSRRARPERHAWRLLRLLGAAGPFMVAVISAGCAVAPAIPLDVVIANGTVFDGTGRPGTRADVGIRGDRIVAIGDLRAVPSRDRFDAAGRYVTPGFVSIHDHTDVGMHSRPAGLVTQGITTAITNPDGFHHVDPLAAPGADGGLGINFGAYVGFNAVWEDVVGLEDHRPDAAQIERMRGKIRESLAAGAFGVSAGLDYKPGFWATTGEVIAVVSAARDWRTNFPNHERLYEGNGLSSLAGMRETIEIGARAGLVPVVTHMKMLVAEKGRADDAFAMFAASARAGVPVGVDAYPYTYAATDLDQILVPAWAQEGGRTGLLHRLKDPVMRAKIAVGTDAIIRDRIRGAENVYLPDLGAELTDIAAAERISPGEAVLVLLERGQTHVMLRSATEADLARILRDPLTAVSCDCGAITSTTGHPRNWGSFPRFLGLYVREQQLVDWPEAIRKMTSLPAAMIGLAQRGRLAVGMYADVTVLDPQAVIDRATLANPTARSEGIDAVLVNGQFAWRDGQLHPGAGRWLRRSPHEPTRAGDVAADGASVRVVAQLPGGVRVDVAAVSAAGLVNGTGHVRVEGLPGGRLTFGAPLSVQTAPGWVAIVGLARQGRRDLGATLYLEQSAPLAGGQPVLALEVDGRVVIEAPLPAGALQVAVR